ncbi:MAG: hypothetical protein LBN05_01995 [Oscillospiraceae bacterium]|jgi:hypothetical protein|nr:hypothetical protein [Oscillospiraceae bacterium]
MEQDLGSVARYVLAHTDATPYYHNMPSNFTTPAVYFPAPSIAAGEGTTSGYAMAYRWDILFFAPETQGAIDRAVAVASAILANHREIPQVDPETLEVQPEHPMLLDKPTTRIIEAGVAQLSLSWISRRGYPEDDSPPVLHHSYKIVDRGETDGKSQNR